LVFDKSHCCIQPFDCFISWFVLLSNYFVLNFGCWKNRHILEAKHLLGHFKNMKKTSPQKIATTKLLHQQLQPGSFFIKNVNYRQIFGLVLPLNFKELLKKIYSGSSYFQNLSRYRKAFSCCRRWV